MTHKRRRQAGKNDHLCAQVMPEMAEAGAREIERFDPRFDDPSEVSERVFRVMMRASLSSRASSPKGAFAAIKRTKK